MSLADFSQTLETDLYSKFELISKEAYAHLFFDPQVFENSCAINAQLQLLEEYTGMQIQEDVMATYAQKQGFFSISGRSEGGTTLENFNKLLSKAGVKSEIIEFNGVDGLKETLNNGRDVLVGIDSNELYEGIEGQIGADHAVRILGYDNGTFSIQDPNLGLKYVSEEELSNAWDDFNFSGVVVEPPDTSDISNIQNNIQEMHSSVTYIDLIEARYEDYLEGQNAFENDTYEYATLGSAQDTVNLDDLPQDVQNDIDAINIDVGNIVATGGYIALMQFFKDNPKKQKNVTKVALALGAFDAFTDFSGDQVALDIEINPLLITSLAYFISQVASNSKNIKWQKRALRFSNILTKGFRVIEYAGYAAIAVEAVDLLTGLEASEFFLELVDTMDFLDIFGDVAGTAADGVDIVEGLATFGLSIAASKVIRFLFKRFNKDDLATIKILSRKTTPKKTLAKLLESDAPVPMLIGPYNEMIRERS